MRYRHYDRKGLDTILATLLLVVIVVVMTVIVYSWSQGVFGAILPTPPTGREILTIENQGFDTSNLKLTLYLRNTGSTPTTLASYYVQDQNGNQYARTSWTVPAAPPANIVNGTGVFLPINTACTSCTQTGNSFTFQSGNSYTITLVTQRNNQFSFTIIR
jgi:FlaG/FlaF family flagellin (archaellin)